MNNKKMILLFLLGISLFTCFIAIKKGSSASYENLMIVAHPDDETLFGGNALAAEKYTVICLTNGDNPTRKKEFQTVMKQTNDKGIIFSFPDKTNGKRDDWKNEKEAIEKKLLPYIKDTRYKRIVTHNPDGEYGHIHHKMTNQIVTELCETYDKKEKLYYFEPYFKKKETPPSLPVLSSTQTKQKTELLNMYSSQKKTIAKLSHIIPYERFIPSKKW